MRFAIPMANGRLCPHFGHCQSFALIDADMETKEITEQGEVAAPPHQPGLLPGWLAERGANVIIAGGMGGRAKALFDDQGIQVVIGAPEGTPEEIVKALLAGKLVTGENICDH